MAGEVFHQTCSQPQRFFFYLWVVRICLYVQLFIWCLSYCPMFQIFSKLSHQEVSKTVFSAIFCLAVYFNTDITQGMGAAYGQQVTVSVFPSIVQHSSMSHLQSAPLKVSMVLMLLPPAPHNPLGRNSSNSGIKLFFTCSSPGRESTLVVLAELDPHHRKW